MPAFASNFRSLLALGWGTPVCAAMLAAVCLARGSRAMWVMATTP